MFYRTLNEEERNTQFGQEILKRIQLVDTKIKELDASIGNHQRNVGNYASHWDSLGFSIQRIARRASLYFLWPECFFRSHIQ